MAKMAQYTVVNTGERVVERFGIWFKPHVQTVVELTEKQWRAVKAVKWLQVALVAQDEQSDLSVAKKHSAQGKKK